MTQRRTILIMVGLAIPMTLATASAVWAATTTPPTAGQAGFRPSARPTLSTAAPAAPAAAVNTNCTLVVPPNPLSAAGLATPYQLVATDRAQGACHENDAAQSAFVQATIVDPATGALSVYDPLVVDAGQAPAAAPLAPTVPTGAVVGVWFGFNGDVLTLRSNGNSLAAGNCVNGTPPFGQFAYCDAPAFFRAANVAVAAGMLTVPPLQTARDGKPCPTTRDFSLVDMDQSDNVTSVYLGQANGATAQNTAANRARFAGATTIVNASDNRLLDAFVDPALGCTPFTAPNLADGGTPTTSLGLNELQAAQQAAPVALIPPSDPMAMNGAQMSLAKTNLYRVGVNQPALAAIGTAARTYCADLVATAPARLTLDRAFTVQAPTPDAGAANNLFTFLAQRLSASYTVLNCAALVNAANPVHLVTNNNGVTTDATFGAAGGPAPVGSTTASPGASTTASPGASTTASPGAGTTPSPSGSAPATPRTRGPRPPRPTHF